jgi:hypothetical protein
VTLVSLKAHKHDNNQTGFLSFRKFIKFDRKETKKLFDLRNCNYDHPLKDDKVIVSWILYIVASFNRKFVS